MCIIIDANAAHEIGSAPIHPDARPVLRWLSSKRGTLALGGRLTDELYRTPLKRLLVELTRAGAAKLYQASLIHETERRVHATGACISNDLHILALALVSGARLLYSRDQALHADFRHPEIINSPRGHIYSSLDHQHLLWNAVCGRQPPRRDGY
jgi:hypothetical protein